MRDFVENLKSIRLEYIAKCKEVVELKTQNKELEDKLVAFNKVATQHSFDRKNLEAQNNELSKSVERITKLYEQERDCNQMFERKDILTENKELHLHNEKMQRALDIMGVSITKEK